MRDQLCGSLFFSTNPLRGSIKFSTKKSGHTSSYILILGAFRYRTVCQEVHPIFPWTVGAHTAAGARAKRSVMDRARAPHICGRESALRLSRPDSVVKDTLGRCADFGGKPVSGTNVVQAKDRLLGGAHAKLRSVKRSGTHWSVPQTVVFCLRIAR